MRKNIKATSKKMASTASKVLSDPKASKTQKSLAGSALSQSGTTKQTGKKMESLASKVVAKSKYSTKSKKLAGSVLSQSNKAR